MYFAVRSDCDKYYVHILYCFELFSFLFFFLPFFFYSIVITYDMLNVLVSLFYRKSMHNIHCIYNGLVLSCMHGSNFSKFTM